MPVSVLYLAPIVVLLTHFLPPLGPVGVMAALLLTLLLRWMKGWDQMTRFQQVSAKRFVLDAVLLILILRAPHPLAEWALLWLMGAPPFGVWQPGVHKLTALLPFLVALPIWRGLHLVADGWLLLIPILGLIGGNLKSGWGWVYCGVWGLLWLNPTLGFVVSALVMVVIKPAPNWEIWLDYWVVRPLVWLPSSLFRAGEVILVEGPFYGLAVLIKMRKQQ